VIDLGISGETSTSFFQVGTGNEGPGAVLRNTNYGTPPVSQDALMLSDIAAEKAAGRTISTVTIQLGSNDLFRLILSPGFFDLTPGEQQQLVLQTLATVQANDNTLLTELRGQLPGAELILMGYYDPFAPFLGDPSSPLNPLARAAHDAIPALDRVIAGEAAAFGGVYVDTYSPFVGHELALTYTATGNIHPNAAGYAAITSQLAQATVPEPGSFGLVLSGGVGIGLSGIARRRGLATA
jgi:lysophospholipase L1-like esterase